MDDSKVYANHAKKKFIDLDDVRLAVKMQLERSFTNPPPRDVLLDVARTKNNIPLPFVKPNNGLRLPPDRYCLNATNYRLKNATKKIQKPAHSLVGNNQSSGQPRPKVEGNKTGVSIVKRPGTLATVARTQTISIPKPVLKFSTGNTLILDVHYNCVNFLLTYHFILLLIYLLNIKYHVYVSLFPTSAPFHLLQSHFSIPFRISFRTPTSKILI